MPFRLSWPLGAGDNVLRPYVGFLKVEIYWCHDGSPPSDKIDQTGVTVALEKLIGIMPDGVISPVTSMKGARFPLIGVKQTLIQTVKKGRFWNKADMSMSVF